MKIAILTLPLHTNFGGILQAYALQTVLERMGHQVVIINKKREYKLPYWKYPLVYIKRIIKKYFLQNKNIRIFEEQYMQRIYPIISQNTHRFIDKYIHLYDVNTLRDIKEGYFDAIFVGSDQVWRPKYFMPMFKTEIEDAFLNFAKKWDIKRIAYAASFGTDRWEYTPSQTKLCIELIKTFDAVSVREESGVKLCKEYLKIDALHTLDPTMLLNKEDYIKLFEVANTRKSSGTLLYYILDETPEKMEIIKQIAKDRNLAPFRVNSKIENPYAPLKERIQPSVESWLRGFYDAEYVITDSFHACVFSIIFGKPFFVIGNEKRGLSRIESLLKMFGLEHRLINQNEQYLDSKPVVNIDAIIYKERDKSYSYINQILRE